jgi:hypothetical protein
MCERGCRCSGGKQRASAEGKGDNSLVHSVLQEQTVPANQQTRYPMVPREFRHKLNLWNYP